MDSRDAIDVANGRTKMQRTVLIRERLRGEQGVTLLFLMFMLVVMGLSLTAAAQQWTLVVQRSLEADLLAKGIEIQRAIQLYSATQKAGRVTPGEMYPLTLEELTKQPKPSLRKVYKDPMTRDKWVLIRDPRGRIMGVRSSSTATPIKQHDFPPEVRHFEGLPRYADWTFQYPNASTAQQQPAGTPVPGSPTTPPTPAPAVPGSP